MSSYRGVAKIYVSGDKPSRNFWDESPKAGSLQGQIPGCGSEGEPPPPRIHRQNLKTKVKSRLCAVLFCTLFQKILRLRRGTFPSGYAHPILPTNIHVLLIFYSLQSVYTLN